MKTFKEYLKERKKSILLRTSFGKHSLEKKTEAPILLKTSFGSHSEKKHVSESTIYDWHKENSIAHHPAITDYTEDSFSHNYNLHEKANDPNHKIRPNVLKDIHGVDAALDHHKTKSDVTVYTGVHADYLPLKQLSAAKPGSKITVHHPAFLSTTTNKEKARDFANLSETPNQHKTLVNAHNTKHGSEHTDVNKIRHILKIHVPAGTHAASIREHSNHMSEDEVLLHRGHHLEIDPKPEHESRPEGSYYIWHSKVVKHEKTAL